jgi:hypothetical protein
MKGEHRRDHSYKSRHPYLNGWSLALFEALMGLVPVVALRDVTLRDVTLRDTSVSDRINSIEICTGPNSARLVVQPFSKLKSSFSKTELVDLRL